MSKVSYENKEYILQFFEGVHEEENKAELIEVYRKAQAFDRIVEERNQAGTAMYGKDNDVVDRVIDRAFWDIDGIIVEYEREDE